MKRKFLAMLLVMSLAVMYGTAVFAMEKTDTYFKLRKYESGIKHDDVRHIQNALCQGGYLELDELTDIYGPKTEEAIKIFQSDNGLKVDGIAGAHTIEAMFDAGLMNELDTIILKPNEKSESVKKLQLVLMKLNLMQTDDGQPTIYYGKKTKEAVKQYQIAKGLESDGVAGTITLHEMQKDGYLFLASTSGESEDEVVSSQEYVGVISQTVLKPESQGQDVQVLQAILAKEGMLSTEDQDGSYGQNTKNGVMLFQQKYALKEDGVAGVSTINKMISLGYAKRPKPVVSRNSGDRRFGEYIHWSDMMQLIDKGTTVFVLEDFYTGTTFNMLASYGGVHSDVEPLTAEDAHIIKELWGGEYSWVRRPMLVHYKGRVFAASLNGMPHAGLDNQPEGKYVHNRSGKFGYGYNLDFVKGNDFDGHLCLHFYGSKLHKNNRSDPKHQKCVRIAAGLE